MDAIGHSSLTLDYRDWGLGKIRISCFGLRISQHIVRFAIQNLPVALFSTKTGRSPFLLLRIIIVYLSPTIILSALSSSNLSPMPFTDDRSVTEGALT
jgi:hypothetical protein